MSGFGGDDVAVAISLALLGVAALLLVVRLTRGPTMLDRALAFDVLVAVALCGVGLDAAVRRTTDNLPFMLVAALLGFVGSVSIARYSPGSDAVDAIDTIDAADADEEGSA